MFNVEYSKNNRVRFLFPNKREQENAGAAIKSRLKTYLNKDEYDWAYQFVKTVMEHDDYTKIKEELHKTRITDLCKYHDYLQASLDDPNTNIHFLDILTAFNQIGRKIDMIISRMLYIDINFSSMSSKTDIEYTLNLFGFYLFQEDSPIISEIQKKYLEEVKKYQNREELKPIIQMEYSNIEKKTLEIYRQYIGKYNMVLNSKRFESTGNYVNERYANFLRVKVRDRVNK